MKNSLSNTGLSLSQAQSISNLCYQRALEIANQISTLNNVEKTVKIDGETFIETKGVKMPANIIDLIEEQAKLHATQAFLMENIKAKDAMLKQAQKSTYQHDIPMPERPDLASAELTSSVSEEWGWEQLSPSEINEYLEAESYAAHIGKFIHKNGKLDILRQELPTLKTLEWITIKDGERTPLKVTIHNTTDDLLKLHEKLATKHRNCEQRVNYFKAKVKNLVTVENSRIAAENAKKENEISTANYLLNEKYQKDLEAWSSNRKECYQKFENERHTLIKSIAELRIQVDPRFQPVVDAFLTSLN